MLLPQFVLKHGQSVKSGGKAPWLVVLAHYNIKTLDF